MTIAKLAFGLLLMFGKCSTAHAQSVGPDYFSGKTVTVYVGFAAGGAAATEALLVARHLQQHIPGRPTVVVGYRPGAGGRILNNYLYNTAPATGFEIGRVDNGVAIASLLDDSAIRFDARRFGWIGSFSADGWVFFLRRESGVASLEKLRDAKTKAKVGSISAVHKTYTNAKLIQQLFGLSFDMVTGYPSGKDIELAVARGEIDGSVANYAGFMQRSYRDYQSGSLSVLLQSGHGPQHTSLPKLEGSPVIWSQTSGESASLLQAAGLPWDAPFVAPPGTPAPVVAILRAAFESTSRDAEFRAEYEKVVGAEVDFTPGAQLESDVVTVSQSPPSVVSALRRLYAGE